MKINSKYFILTINKITTVYLFYIKSGRSRVDANIIKISLSASVNEHATMTFLYLFYYSALNVTKYILISRQMHFVIHENYLMDKSFDE